VRTSSAVLFGEIDPKNSPTEFAFEYGPWERIVECAIETGHINSVVYGPIGGTFEVKGLQPDTRYWYRPVAVNDKGEHAEGEERR
jgi:phosphodiesterase/alkaline phosphatase D-like protein